jgi:1-acyl-sn-glycerol-3-phosphate acyltransferase
MDHKEWRKTMVRAILHGIVRLLFALLSRLTIEGLENLPESGAAILAANHLGRLDSPLIFCLIHRTDVTGLVGDSYQKSPFFRPLVEAVHGIWIDRNGVDKQALRTARQYLQQGGMLGIAPEGTRSRDGSLMEAKTGAAYLADKANVPVIPIAIWGTEDAIDKLFHMHRPYLFVRIGQPFCLPPLARHDRNAALQQNTDEIMCRIAALLPSRYHGFYAGHPRLQELLAAAQNSEKLPA